MTSGQIDSCESNLIQRCRAVAGYDGPTGWGTPNGITAFASTATGNTVSVVNPGTYDLQAGARYALPAIKAYDSATGQTLTYSATGLPSGLAINTTNGVIEGLLSATPANAKVKVTVKDGTGASATISFGIVSVKALTSTYHAGSGLVRLDLNLQFTGNKCMNDARNLTANGTPVQVYTCENVASETGWSYGLSPAPGVPGTILIHGRCMYATGASKAALYTCNGATSEKWYLGGVDGEIINAANGRCLAAPSTANGTQLTVATCTGVSITGATNQAWIMPASPVTSGVAWQVPGAEWQQRGQHRVQHRQHAEDIPRA